MSVDKPSVKITIKTNMAMPIQSEGLMDRWVELNNNAATKSKEPMNKFRSQLGRGFTWDLSCGAWCLESETASKPFSRKGLGTKGVSLYWTRSSSELLFGGVDSRSSGWRRPKKPSSM